MADAPKQWMPRERWDALVRGEDCSLCNVIKSAEPEDEFSLFVADLRISRLTLSRNQFPAGYCILICNKHVREPYHLTAEEQALFFGDMWRAARALERVFNPVKMNFSLLGNSVPHLHAHIKPRCYGDPAPGRPTGPGDPVVFLAPEEYKDRVQLIRAALEWAEQNSA